MTRASGAAQEGAGVEAAREALLARQGIFLALALGWVAVGLLPRALVAPASVWAVLFSVQGSLHLVYAQGSFERGPRLALAGSGVALVLLGALSLAGSEELAAPAQLLAQAAGAATCLAFLGLSTSASLRPARSLWLAAAILSLPGLGASLVLLVLERFGGSWTDVRLFGRDGLELRLVRPRSWTVDLLAWLLGVVAFGSMGKELSLLARRRRPRERTT